MRKVETVFASQAYRNRCEDRVAVFSDDERTVIVVCDGAGGIGCGDLAAESVLSEIKSQYEFINSADQWADLLGQLDQRISTGESTCVVVDIRPYGIAGASVGDSGAWIINPDHVVDLTQNQSRKPLIGSGSASPVAFVHSPLNGLLLVGTDGLFNYAKREAITQLVAQAEFYTIPKRCFELVRLPSGEYWDDIGIVAARNTPPRRTRQRYSIDILE